MSFEHPSQENTVPTVSPEEALEIRKNKVLLQRWVVMEQFATRRFSYGDYPYPSPEEFPDLEEAYEISSVEFPQGGDLPLNSDPRATLAEFKAAGLTPENHELVRALFEYKGALSAPRSLRQEDGSFVETPNYRTDIESARKHFKDTLDKYKLLLTGAY
jgi:hypothetical protein